MGAATLRAFLEAGANVVGMDINAKDGATQVAAAAAATSGKAEFLAMDVADPADVEAAFSQAVGMLGWLNVLAHPAAIQAHSAAASVTASDWDRMMAVNVRGTMLTNQAAYRYMAGGGGGSIINFGSVSGLRPEPIAAAYSVSKGAVHSWTRTAAAAWGADRVRVNAILPAISTPMYEEAMARMSEEELTAHHWRNEDSIALGKAYGDAARDLGPVMVFLASDASRFITGQLLPVDGGQTSVR
jgi:3-oxoacyl-[acyl-carrier protein] reductase